MSRVGRPRKVAVTLPGHQPVTTEAKRSVVDDAFGGKSCAVYIMRCEGRIKIGHSHDPSRRRATLQVGRANPVEVLWAFRMSWVDAKIVERLAHKWLKDRRSHAAGEWFRIAADYARDVVRGLVIKLGIAGFVEIDLFAEGTNGDGNHVRRITNPHSMKMFQRGLTSGS